MVAGDFLSVCIALYVFLLLVYSSMGVIERLLTTDSLSYLNTIILPDS